MLKYIICDVALALLILAAFRYFALIVRVKGNSMNDALANRDILFARRYTKRRDVRRFDVVLCRYPGRRGLFVKRVIGMPGEVIAMQKGRVIINGFVLAEEVPKRACNRNLSPRCIGQDQYFVMGDNRPSSSDSRNPRVGAIHRGMIVARCTRVLLPKFRKIQYEGKMIRMKRRIMVFGDSNTWGWNPANTPETITRWSDEERWTGVMERELGENFTVINEGLNGRTTVWDDPIEEYRCGKQQIIPALDTAAPVELLIIMLGTNDCKPRHSASAFDIAEGAGLIMDYALSRPADFANDRPKILLVCPPRLGAIENRPNMSACFENGVEKSAQLAPLYKAAADRHRAHFFDADAIVHVSDKDGVHMEVDQHEILGRALAEEVRKILK